MAFVTEDGTGIATATSYVTLAEARAYWDDHGFDHSKYPPDSQLERALIRATQHIETFFARLFRGCRLYPDTQRLSWPRTDIYVYGKLITSEVPEGVKSATCEYAQRILVSGDLFPDPGGFDETGSAVRRKAVRVGPIETETSYEQGTEFDRRQYPQADYLLTPFIFQSDGVVRN
jgi:hypothetical protein